MSTAVDCVSKKSVDSSPARKSVSLSLNLTNFNSVFGAATSNPKEDLRKGFFDVDTRLPGRSGAVSDPIAELEDRIDTFLEAQNVNYINLSEYLKALSLFEERKKCQVSLKIRNSSRKDEEKKEKKEPKADSVGVTMKPPARAP